MPVSKSTHDESDRGGVSRRRLLGTAAAGSAAALVSAATPAGAASTRHGTGTPRRPLLPVRSSQPLGSVLTLLGTSGGPQAEYVRTGTSSVLTVDGHNYVIDAGRGSVTQYLNAGLRFRVLDAMFITHLHADHLADYYNFFLLEGGKPNGEGDQLHVKRAKRHPIQVFGPGPAGALPPAAPGTPTIAPNDPTPGISDLTNKLTEGFAYSHNIFIREDGILPVNTIMDVHDIAVPDPRASPQNTAPEDMKPFHVYEDTRVRVSAILVPHGPIFPAFAYRFDTDHGSVVFSGDTKRSDNVVRLARGADTLVHEVLDFEFYVRLGAGRQLLEHFKNAHTFTTQVGRVAHSAGVDQLVLNHLAPSNPRQFSDAQYLRKASRHFSGKVHVGNDLDRVPLRPGRRR